MNKVRMKVLVGSVRKIVNERAEPTAEEVMMQAVYSDQGVNKSWCKWTPSITYNFTVSNPDVFGQFQAGQFYYVDLTETTMDDPV